VLSGIWQSVMSRRTSEAFPSPCCVAIIRSGYKHSIPTNRLSDWLRHEYDPNASSPPYELIEGHRAAWNGCNRYHRLRAILSAPSQELSSSLAFQLHVVQVAADWQECTVNGNLSNFKHRKVYDCTEDAAENWGFAGIIPK
jgi:hypothetical protein